jgi:hypothetical protein
MDKAKPYLKAAAVASSALLVGVFIGYRAGAFSTPEPNSALQPAESTSTQPTTEGPITIMGGSKSAPAFGETIGLTPAEQPLLPLELSEEPKAAIFFGGAKSDMAFRPSDLPRHKPVLTGTKLDSIMSGITTNLPPIAPLFPPTNPSPLKPGE